MKLYVDKRSFCQILLLGLLLLPQFTGCNRSTPSAGPKEPASIPRAATIEEENFLLIGLVPERRVFAQFERYKPIADYLAGEVGRKTNLIVIPDYGSIADDFNSTGMDAAFLGSFSYAVLHTKFGIEPLARPEGPDGVSTYHGVIFARKDSGIKTVQDMKSKRFVGASRVSSAGYLLPIVYFKNQGIGDYRSYFRELYYAGTHDDAVYDVLNRKADVGGAKSTTLNALTKTDPRISSEIQVLSVSPEFPENALCVRQELDASLKEALKKALLGMHLNPRGREALSKFGAVKFIETSDSDYRPLYQYIRQAGIDLSHFRYADER